jgi:hypothetical protein
VLLTQQKKKKGKSVGKTIFVGYKINFSTAMNEATTRSSANFVVDKFVIKTVKQKKVRVLTPVPFTITGVTSNSVTLKPAGKQNFPKGGMIVIISSTPSGVTSSSGVSLPGSGVIAITPGGKGLRLVSQ